MMDDEEDILLDDEEEPDGGGSSDNDDDELVDLAMEPEPSTTQEKQDAEEFPFEVFKTTEIVQLMVDCIKDVNSVVQVCAHKT